MESLKTIAARVLQKRGLKTQADASRIVFLATAILAELSPELAKEVKITHAKDGVLYLEVQTSVGMELGNYGRCYSG
jgi:hypothetical protein